MRPPPNAQRPPPNAPREHRPPSAKRRHARQAAGLRDAYRSRRAAEVRVGIARGGGAQWDRIGHDSGALLGFGGDVDALTIPHRAVRGGGAARLIRVGIRGQEGEAVVDRAGGRWVVNAGPRTE